MGRHRWKLRACKHGNFHRKNCSSGRHGCNKLHLFCTQPSTKKRQPKHFHAVRCAWKAHRPLDPDGWKWWKTKQSLSRPQPIPHRNASNRPQLVPHWKVAMKPSLVRPFVSNLSTDFILLVPNYPNLLELGYPNHCLFGHVLEGSDPLESIDSLKEISSPTYADICNTLMEPRSGISTSNQTASASNRASNLTATQNAAQINNKKLNRRKRANRCKRAKVNFNKDTKSVLKPRSDIPKSRNDIPKPRSDVLKPRSDVPKPRSDIPKPRSGPPQRLGSVAGHPKNRLYIDSGALVHIIFNCELLE